MFVQLFRKSPFFSVQAAIFLATEAHAGGSVDVSTFSRNHTCVFAALAPRSCIASYCGVHELACEWG